MEYNDFKTPKMRYQNDATFRILVDMMHAQIAQCRYTPSEMREAAILASIMHERMNVRKIIVPEIPEVIEECLNALHKWEKKWITSHSSGSEKDRSA